MKNKPFGNLSKRLRLGKIIYKLYFYPKAFIKRVIDRGIVDIVTDSLAQKQMENATYALTPISNIQQEAATTLDIYFLSGKKFWYQTCFCAYSMSKNSHNLLRPIVYDDGSLSKQYQEEIIRIFPNAKIVLKPEIEEYIDKYLPQNKFPYLRERRINYPNIRKLTDIHVGSQGWKLVLDSDMLFFRSPNVLLDWLESPQTPCHMIDVETAYGYSRDLMTSLAQAEIAEKINVGICGLKSEDIDWEKLEYWCKVMIENEGTHYYQEQALIAMLMAGQNCAIAPESDYIVMPNRDEVINPQAVLHHYVSESKPWYFRNGWKRIVSGKPDPRD